MSSEESFEQHVTQLQDEVQKAITAGKNNEAIRMALQNTPLQCKDEDTKVRYSSFLSHVVPLHWSYRNKRMMQLVFYVTILLGCCPSPD